MIAANEAKIPIFCTGGIGGVHRDWIDSMDVSADLQELYRTPVAVISSGVKSILDIEKTLEYLETMGVCVVSFNSNGSREFPAFFTSKSGIDAPYNCRNEQEAAKLIYNNLKTGFNSGLLIGNPIPEEYSGDKNLIDHAIKEALSEIKRLNIKGKKVTPFLLEKINKITKGKSLASNVALIKNNARVSAKIAIELKKLLNSFPNSNKSTTSFIKDEITVIGGINLDNIYKLEDEKTIHLKGVTQPTTFHQSLGGVGRNMAEALINFGLKNTSLISTLGQDLPGRLIKDELKNIGFNTDKIETLENISTGSYFALFDSSGEINLAAGSMKAHNYISVDLIKKNIQTLLDSEICVIDADIPVETIKFICEICNSNSIPIWFNPTDIRKCKKILDANCLSKITYISPNSKELFILFEGLLKQENSNDKILNDICKKYTEKVNENFDFNDLKHILKYMLKYVPFIMLSRGSNDFILASSIDLKLDKKNQLPSRRTFSEFKKSEQFAQIITFPVVKLSENEIINVTGAGDSTSSGIITGIVRNYNLDYVIYNGLTAGKFALLSQDNVSKDLHLIDEFYLQDIISKQKLNIKKILL
jgi:pseudouridine-5'-phosphate glycosidase/pseudouridine kinase